MNARLTVWAAVAMLVASGPGHAASFDCAKAGTPIEKAICANQDLSDLDTRLAATYRDQRGRLTPEGADWLKAQQQDWLRWLRATCIPAGNRNGDLVECLRDQYTVRVKQLERSVVMGAGGFRVMLAVNHEVVRGPNGAPMPLGPFERPAIELPKDAPERKWNGDVLAFARPAGDLDDTATTVTAIGWATSTLLSANVIFSMDSPTGQR